MMSQVSAGSSPTERETYARNNHTGWVMIFTLYQYVAF